MRRHATTATLVLCGLAAFWCATGSSPRRACGAEPLEGQILETEGLIASAGRLREK
jgi:hypothetical protein